VTPPLDEVQIISRCPGETQALGRTLGACLQAGDWLGLTGELGAGKTCLVQGLAAGLGVPAGVPVTSPTFVIRQTYPGRIPVFHLDLYRLASSAELADLGYEEVVDGEGVCVVEWCDQIPEANPGRGLRLVIEILDGSSRQLTLFALDPRGGKILQALTSRDPSVAHIVKRGRE
jgi:tRNA threonylcarbamoyladenosine biosynthesis protein TsaE